MDVQSAGGIARKKTPPIAQATARMTMLAVNTAARNIKSYPPRYEPGARREIPSRIEPGKGLKRRLAGPSGACLRGVSIIEAMVIDMNEAQVCAPEQLRQVLAGTQAMEFRGAEDDEGRYGWIVQVLRRFGYRQLGSAERGAVLAHLRRFSGYRRAQVTRLVVRWVSGKPLMKS